MEKTRRKPKAFISITSFRGSVGAKHYYGSLTDQDFDKTHLFRPVTKEEILNFPDRFLHYKEGDPVRGFDTWREVVIEGVVVAERKGIDLNDLFVEGIPNNPTINYATALEPLDTRAKCKQCGKVFTAGEGCYNSPKGLFCTECYKSIKK